MRVISIRTVLKDRGKLHYIRVNNTLESGRAILGMVLALTTTRMAIIVNLSGRMINSMELEAAITRKENSSKVGFGRMVSL